MDTPTTAVLKLDLEAHNLNATPFVYHSGPDLTGSVSIKNSDVTLNYQINSSSSISATFGKDHAFLNYKLTF